MAGEEWARACDACDGNGAGESGSTCSVCGGSGELWGNASSEYMKRMAKRRAHHFIPRWYQCNFTTGGGTLFWCDTNNGQVKKTAPRALFFENGLYHAVEPSTGHLQADAEGALAELDYRNATTVRELRRRIAGADRQWGEKTVSIADLHAPLKQLAGNLLLRSPRLFETSIDRVRATEKSTASENEYENIERCVPIAMMKQIVAMSQEIPEHLRNVQMGIGTVQAGEVLIIGDCMAGNLMVDSSRVYGLPIDSKTAILWVQDARNELTAWTATEHRARIVEIRRCDARRFNRSVRMGSRVIAGCQKRTIEALVSSHRE